MGLRLPIRDSGTHISDYYRDHFSRTYYVCGRGTHGKVTLSLCDRLEKQAHESFRRATQRSYYSSCIVRLSFGKKSVPIPRRSLVVTSFRPNLRGAEDPGITRRRYTK